MHAHDGRSELFKVAIKRRADARRLYEGGRPHYSGAMYLAGYSVECKMKAIVMEIMGVVTLRGLAEKLRMDDGDIYTHGLDAILELSPLRDQLRRSDVWLDFVSQVNRWRPSWRYDPRERSGAEAKRYLDAVDRVYNWLDAGRYGGHRG
ncbi:MAG TPA: HEPN domain-containing protein [Myxococcota bacterium]|mgnify:CR=1 FL=1|nr:HEPN domain-containing protein [Myxococcota bacterium]